MVLRSYHKGVWSFLDLFQVSRGVSCLLEEMNEDVSRWILAIRRISGGGDMSGRGHRQGAAQSAC